MRSHRDAANATSSCHNGGMRTTVSLEEDVAAAIEQVRRQQGVGISQAINQLIRAGLSTKQPRRRFRQRSVALGLRVDVTNIAEALETLDGPTQR
jgi:metal-responsive CopG/Arc/MetJ family transcriptional regulator